MTRYDPKHLNAPIEELYLILDGIATRQEALSRKPEQDEAAELETQEQSLTAIRFIDYAEEERRERRAAQYLAGLVELNPEGALERLCGRAWREPVEVTR